MVIVKAVLPHGVSTRDPIDVDIEIPAGSGYHAGVSPAAALLLTEGYSRWSAFREQG